MSDDEYEEIRETAEAERLTVSAWVRRALREARSRPPRARAVHEPRAAYDAAEPGLHRRVRVELELDETLLESVRLRFHQPTWRAAVEYALRRASVRPLSKDEALAMRGSGWDGDVDALRSGDPGAVW